MLILYGGDLLNLQSFVLGLSWVATSADLLLIFSVPRRHQFIRSFETLGLLGLMSEREHSGHSSLD